MAASMAPWPDTLYLSNSTLNQYHSCERKLEFAKIYEFPNTYDEGNLAARCGIALHHAYQTYLTTQSLDHAALSLLLHYPINLNSDPQDGRSLEACYAALTHLTNHPRLYTYEVAIIRNAAGNLVPAIEVPFIIEIVGHSLPCKVIYRGFIDAILFDAATNTYIVADLKTTRTQLKDYYPKYAYSDQFLPYGLVLESITQSIIGPFNVIVINLYTDIIAPEVKKYEYLISDHEVLAWCDKLRRRLYEINERMRWNDFERNGESCMAYNRTCPYFKDLCGTRNRDYLAQLKELQVQALIAEHGKYTPFTPPAPWISTILDLSK